MNFGAEFDEDVFERPKEKRAKSPIRPGAKVYLPEWFLDPKMTEGEDEEEVRQCLRHKADYQYFSKDYSEASVTYERILQLLPASNVPCRRECMENLSRSFFHMGHLEKALEWALKMHDASVSTDQKIVSLNLLATVCHSLEKYEEELEALHSCLEPHKGNPDLWFRLGCCYAGMFKIDLPNSKSKIQEKPYCCAFRSRVGTRNSVPQSNLVHCQNLTGSNNESVQCTIAPNASNSTVQCSAFTGEPDQSSPSSESVDKCELCTLGVQMISACLLRARLLMNNSEKNHFTAEKYNRMNEMITECLNCMEVDQQFIDEASKMLKSEMISSLQAAKEGLARNDIATL